MQDTRPPAERAEHYRFRAEELRTIARNGQTAVLAKCCSLLRRIINGADREASGLAKTVRLTRQVPADDIRTRVGTSRSGDYTPA